MEAVLPMTVPALQVEDRPLIPLAGPHGPGAGNAFPVRRVYCIGRNYAEHTREMGGNPEREAPFFFMKPTDAIQPVGADAVADHAYPPGTSDYHHEVELVVALKGGGRDIAVENALEYVFGYAVGLDMTRRDLQGDAKKGARPWEIGKASDHSAPCGVMTIAGAESTNLLRHGTISLRVNGKTRQSAPLSDMIWSVAEQISILSRYYELKAGDVIYTGTPAGVAAVHPGDVVEATVDAPGGGLSAVRLRIV